ncbi:hypothetical protein HH308_04580 [Gordonia sp. TBRC 11910]|uniref:Uncharacterized protein n=1 Tax=Gordonia asplenii TaxID=2725283 RepID=A0A848KR06_9ACTN|nr:hypothetical protein [Gordonia asplenii]NMO00489.1 hypothetical protein [Gordonia asplenii]
MGDYIRVPKQHMIRLGQDLQNVKTQLDAENAAGTTVTGYDHRHGAKVESSEDAFQGAWKTSIKMLSEAIGDLGKVAEAIGNGAEAIDSQLADAANKAAGNLSQFNFHI